MEYQKCVKPHHALSNKLGTILEEPSQEPTHKSTQDLVQKINLGAIS